MKDIVDPMRWNMDTVFEDAPLGMTVVDAVTERRVRVNRAFCEFLGYSEAEALALPLAALVHPDDFEADTRERAKLIAGSLTTGRRAKRYIHRSGRQLWGEYTTTLIRDESGHPSYYISLVQDITAQREAQAKIKEAQELISIAASVGKLGAWAYLAGSRHARCSGATSLLLGVGEEPSLKEILARFRPPTRELVASSFKNCVLGGVPFDVEAEVAAPGNTSTWLRLLGEAELGEAGRVARVRGAVQDITGVKRSQLLLKESQRHMAALLANLPGMAFRAKNAPGEAFLFASQGAEALTGYTVAELSAGVPTFGSLIHPDDFGTVREVIQAALRSRERFQITYRLRARDGEKMVWEQGCGVYDEGGQMHCVEGFITDVTELSRAREELAALNRTLEEQVHSRTAQLMAANSEMEAVAYSIAHDLRAPLTSIGGFVQVLAPSVEKLNPRDAHFLQRILWNVNRMQELTTALLSLAQISGTHIGRTEVDLGRLASEVVRELQHRDSGRAVVLELEGELVASGDPALLRQLLANLLENGWKFSRQAQQTRLTVAAQTTPSERVFSVRDNGVGFEMEEAKRLFTPFARLHPADSFEGTGIGLALVKKIVHAHGGRVWIHSRVGQGTTVSFTLGA